MDRSRLTPLSSFYNDEVVQKISFKDEYSRWKRSLPLAMPAREFTFLNV